MNDYELWRLYAILVESSESDSLESKEKVVQYLQKAQRIAFQEPGWERTIDQCKNMINLGLQLSAGRRLFCSVLRELSNFSDKIATSKAVDSSILELFFKSYFYSCIHKYSFSKMDRLKKLGFYLEALSGIKFLFEKDSFIFVCGSAVTVEWFNNVARICAAQKSCSSLVPVQQAIHYLNSAKLMLRGISSKIKVRTRTYRSHRKCCGINFSYFCFFFALFTESAYRCSGNP